MAYQIREVALPILPSGSPTLRILHLSDLHLTPKRRRAIEFIRTWGELEPDLVISTGDFLAHQDAVTTVLDALEPILTKPGLFVFGSNDYFGPLPKNPLRYLKRDDGSRKLGRPLPSSELDRRLRERGWHNLNSAKLKIEIKGLQIEARGTDDAHLELDDYSLVAGPRDSNAALSIGVTHAPYARVLESMKEDRLDLIFAGHTHGGQVRIPWFKGTKSLTTNCDLPNWRSRGLTKVDNEPYLHVSAGVGYNPFTPIRFLCPSEVSLLKLEQTH